jgi:hypothetical protein
VVENARRHREKIREKISLRMVAPSRVAMISGLADGKRQTPAAIAIIQ